MASKAQVQVTFHWIYVVLAGAVILLFFAGIVVRQKSLAEKELTADVVRILETILAGAGVSEKTKNVIDTSGLADFTLYFSCAEGVGEFGIIGGTSRAQNARDPLFAPEKIQSPQLVTWSLPYAFPFKVMDFLYLTAPTVKYALFSISNPLFDEMEEEFQEIKNVVRLQTPESYLALAPEHFFHIRIVSDGSLDLISLGMPPKLRLLDDERVSFVEIVAEEARYYQKMGDSWQLQGTAQILSLSEEGGGVSEKDPAMFAAIFAGNAEQYSCNLKKALQRLELLIQLYQKKEKQVEGYYVGKGESTGTCMNILVNNRFKNMEQTLQKIKEAVSGCRLAGGTSCTELKIAAEELRDENQQLGLDCIPLY